MADDTQHDATSELNEALAAGFAASNFEGLGPFYTEDASLMPARGKALGGRAEVSAFWLRVANRFNGAQFTTATVKPLGDAARRESGSYTMTTPDGGTVGGTYLFVWQLVDGEWQIESSIWNRSAEGAGTQGQRQGGPGVGQGQRQAGQGIGQAQGAGQGPRGGYRQGGGGYRGGGYRQGGRRPSFQQGGGGVGGGPAQGRGRQGGGQGQGGQGQGGGRRQQGPGQGGAGGYGGGSYDGGLYSGPKG